MYTLHPSRTDLLSLFDLDVALCMLELLSPLERFNCTLLGSCGWLVHLGVRVKPIILLLTGKPREGVEGGVSGLVLGYAGAWLG